MGSRRSLLQLFLSFLVLGFASSSYISNDVLEPHHGSVGRSLLQQRTPCTVDFEHFNYTVITSQCKGPNYPAELCCGAMKQLVCPVHEQINDLKSNCPETFFSYVNLYGKYPPALFSSLCREGQRGLDCTELLAGPPEQQNGARPARAHTPLLLLMLFSLLVFNMS